MDYFRSVHPVSFLQENSKVRFPSIQQYVYTSLSKKYPPLGQEKKVAYMGGGGTIPSPLLSWSLVTPHT
jgi:hypothetical protein